MYNSYMGICLMLHSKSDIYYPYTLNINKNRKKNKPLMLYNQKSILLKI